MKALWAVSLFKRGACVMVDVNYRGSGPPKWMVGTLVGTAQYGRLSRVRIDDVGNSPWSGSTNVHATTRVKAARRGSYY